MNDELPGIEARTAEIVHEIYRPIICGYFAVFALYYLAMTPTHFVLLNGFDLVAMAFAAITAAAVGLAGCWLLRGPGLSPKEIAKLLTAMNILVVCNVLIALNIEFASQKLIYFIIMAMLFALASVGLWQSIVSIALASAALLTFMTHLDSATFSIYAFLAFAAAMASLAIAYFLRRAIASIAKAKLGSENQLEIAQAAREQLRKESQTDSLTGLPNRRAFFATLQQSLPEANGASEREDADCPIWLGTLDLDGFKAVNDTHGHQVGDLLLQQVSERLCAFDPDRCHVSRMGGDEFSIIFRGRQTEQELLDDCQALIALLAEPYVADGRNVRISGSIGCRQIASGNSVRSHVCEADFALMEAKKQGKNRAVIFDQRHAEQSRVRAEIEGALRQANLTAEIHLVFQPQFDLTKEEVVRAEALARWESPIIGNVEPQRFITVAEEAGLISEITQTVVEKAFAELNSWKIPIPISINLSSFDLISDPLIDEIIDSAHDQDVDRRLVEFEVTESAMMSDFEKATANLRRLTSAGFSIALDDFGTGYSNFSYLRALPIEKLKVDKSFLRDPGDPMTVKILSSLAGIARTLDVECLLEGVEDEFDLLTAKRVGAVSVQGYYFGKPMLSSDLIDLVSAKHQKSEQFVAC